MAARRFALVRARGLLRFPPMVGGLCDAMVAISYDERRNQHGTDAMSEMWNEPRSVVGERRCGLRQGRRALLLPRMRREYRLHVERVSVVATHGDGGELLGRRHGRPGAAGGEAAADPEREAHRSATQALESPAERAAHIKPHEDRQPQRLPVKLYCTDELVTIAAPMPGLGPGDVAVAVTPDRRLVIVGRLCADQDESCGTLKQPQKQVLLDEWEVGPYRREIELPKNVDAEHATLTYGNGILVIALPVASEMRPGRLTLDRVATPVRGGRVGAPNRQLGGTSGRQRNARSGAALVAGGAAALYLLRRGATRSGLFALATGGVAPALLDRARRRSRARAEHDASDARKPISGGAAENPVDEASVESFPASDPPSWTGSHARAFE